MTALPLDLLAAAVPVPVVLVTGRAADEGLAGISDALVYSAMAVYAVSLVAYAMDLGARRAGPRPQALVTVGADARSAGAGTAPAGPDPTLPGEPAGEVPRARGDAGGPQRQGRAARIGTSLFVLATLLHVGAIVARGLSVHRVPWGDAYEFALTGSVLVSLVFVVLLRRAQRWSWLGSFVAVPVLLALMIATSFFYTEASALSPALQDSWLVVHVSIAFLASALFTIGFSLAVVQLVQHRQEAVTAAGGQASRFLSRVPDSRSLEQTSFQLHAVAFVLWTFTVVAGAIWAAEAWGRYWGWDPKEVWSFVIWVVYAAYLHARSTAGWAGPRSAWIAVLGFACLMFNFFGVNYLFVGNHSYAL